MNGRATVPVAPSTRTEAEGSLGCEARTTFKAKPAKSQAVDCRGHLLTVYDGSTRAGSLVACAGMFDAYSVAGNLIGTFDDMRDAARSLPVMEAAP